MMSFPPGGTVLLVVNGGDIYNKVNGGSISGPIAIGVLSIFTAAVFLADFSLMIKNGEYRRK